MWTAFILLWLAAGTRALKRRHPQWGWGEAYLAATLVLGTGMALLTEVLSPLHLLDTRVARGLGLLLTVWSGAVGMRRGPRLARPHPSMAWLLPGLVLATTALVAWKSPPNTPDALSYHLARVIHWAQNGSVAPYPTHVLRQIYNMPWAEEAMLWLRLWHGNDAWANFVQWWALAGSFVALALLAREVAGAEALPWVLGLAATLPMALLQASSTQNDLVTGYWMLAFVFWLLRYQAEGSRAAGLYAGLALGLALRTKATAYVWALPWGLWFAWSLARRRAARVAAVAGLAVVALTAGPLTRNTQVFGHPFASTAIQEAYLNEVHSFRALASNLIRNTAVHYRFSYFVYSRVHRWVYMLHEWLDFDESDPRTTWQNYPFPGTHLRVPNEDTTGAPFHFLLLCLASVWAFARGPARFKRYTLVLWVGWVLFAGVLKWQPWIVRLQLPWFLLAMPLVGGWLARWKGRWRLPGAGVLLFLIVYQALPALLYNDLRPLVGPGSIWRSSPDELLVRSLPEATQREYLQALEAARHTACHRIGLVLHEGGWEYPWWYALHEERPGLRLEHILVQNPTARFAGEGRFLPCLIVVETPRWRPPKTWQVLGATFELVFAAQTRPLRLYRLQSAADESAPPGLASRTHPDVPPHLP